MKITIGQIKRDALQAPASFEEKMDVSELESLNNDIRQVGSVDVEGTYSIQGDEIIFSFTIYGKMILPCARTLVDVDYPFELHADEVFSLSPVYGQEEIEKEIHPVEGEVIDLGPYIMEHVALAVPYRVFSDDEEAHRQAVFKGEGWEFISPDAEKDDSIDPRMKKLQSLLDNKKDKDE